ncbi:MAG: PP2C family protein-serine/threonine phosphatase, partial [Planctomycetota bacterium]
MTQPEVFDILDLSAADWRQRVDHVAQTMREVSKQTDPQAMVDAYTARISFGLSERFISLSRRGVRSPNVVIARDNLRDRQPDVWKQRDQLPVITHGLLSDLIYSDRPHFDGNLHVEPDDPAAPLLQDYRSMIAIPNFDNGKAMSMVLLLKSEPNAFNPHDIPQLLIATNLFGRATHNIVLREELQQAYAQVDREMRAIADIQRSLLPQTLPDIPGLDLAAYYQPAQHAGGDYYDLFPLPDGRWGVFIADVSGHGSPAAVLMAVTHALTHTRHTHASDPDDLLHYINKRLTQRYTVKFGAFVTAFYGIYCPTSRTLTYASAGHNPPRLKRCDDGTLHSLDQAQALPLGILDDAAYTQAQIDLVVGDQLVFYTDGVTEAMNADNEQFGPERLDATLENCSLNASGL